MRRPPARIAPGDPTALAAWIAEARAEVEDLYLLTLDATAKKPERRHAKVYLRAVAKRKHQTLGALLDALASPAATPAPASDRALGDAAASAAAAI